MMKVYGNAYFLQSFSVPARLFRLIVRKIKFSFPLLTMIHPFKRDKPLSVATLTVACRTENSDMQIRMHDESGKTRGVESEL